MSARVCILIGAFSGFLSVAFGAFGAHGLATRLSEKNLAIYHTGAQYQMYHALALLGVGILAAAQPGVSVGVAGWCFSLGSLIFSGSLYLLAITDVRWLGAITPVGGLLFMVGWLACAFEAWKLGAPS